MADGVLRLLLVDADPIFRLGLQTGIEDLGDVQLVTVGDLPGALTVLADQTTGSYDAISVVLIDSVTDGLAPTNVVHVPWSICDTLHQTHPQIPILALGNGLSEIALIRAQRAGASGYCTKDSSVQRLVAIARQLHRGETIWPALPSLTNPPPDSTPTAKPVKELRSLRLPWNNQGLREIDEELANIEAVLTRGALAKPKNWGDRIQKLVAEGRQRELRTARQLVVVFGGGFVRKKSRRSSSPGSSSASSPTVPRSASPSPSSPTTPSNNTETTELPSPLDSDLAIALNPTPSLTLPAPSEESLIELQNILFDRCTEKLINVQNNQTGAPLEIDILKPEQRRDLLYLVLRKIDDYLLQSRRKANRNRQTPEIQIQPDSEELRQLWEHCLDDFFQDYQTCQIENQTIQIIPILKNDWLIIEQDIISQIIELDSLLNHLIVGAAIVADGGIYRPGDAIALDRAEALLQNWTLCLANAVVQPLINRLSDIESLKYQFFDRRWMATRYVERFRNDLSWKYRLSRYVETPTAIFESRHWLLVSDGRTIEKMPVYAPRNEELRSLSGIPLGVTLILEARDAVAPRLRSAVSFLGQGTLLILQAVGRGIGLVGRGILQGIGASWQDLRRGQKSDKS